MEKRGPGGHGLHPPEAHGAVEERRKIRCAPGTGVGGEADSPCCGLACAKGPRICCVYGSERASPSWAVEVLEEEEKRIKQMLESFELCFPFCAYCPFIL